MSALCYVAVKYNKSMRVLLWVRYVWAFPGTILGLCFVAAGLLTGGKVSIRNGILEIHGGIVAWTLQHCTPLSGGAQALTLGHVVLGRNETSLAECRAHEAIHVRQYERWGPFFLPAYLLASL